MIQGTLDVWEVLEWFAEASREYRIEGLTISGGEPIEQALAVLELLSRLKAAHPAMTTGLFSGYTERELADTLWRAMQSHLDFAVLGRYNARRRSHHPLVTSTNQVLRLYTARYSMADFAAQSVEVHIDDTGLTQITGFPVLGSPVVGQSVTCASSRREAIVELRSPYPTMECHRDCSTADPHQNRKTQTASNWFRWV